MVDFSDPGALFREFLTRNGVSLNVEPGSALDVLIKDVADSGDLNSIGGKLDLQLRTSSAKEHGKVGIAYSGDFANGKKAIEIAKEMVGAHPDRYYLAGDTVLNDNLVRIHSREFLQRGAYTHLDLSIKSKVNFAFQQTIDALLSERFAAQADELVGVFGDLRPNSVFEEFEVKNFRDGILFNNEAIKASSPEAVFNQTTASSKKVLAFANSLIDADSADLTEVLKKIDIYDGFDPKELKFHGLDVVPEAGKKNLFELLGSQNTSNVISEAVKQALDSEVGPNKGAAALKKSLGSLSDFGKLGVKAVPVLGLGLTLTDTAQASVNVGITAAETKSFSATLQDALVRFAPIAVGGLIGLATTAATVALGVSLPFTAVVAIGAIGLGVGLYAFSDDVSKLIDRLNNYDPNPDVDVNDTTDFSDSSEGDRPAEHEGMYHFIAGDERFEGSAADDIIQAVSVEKVYGGAGDDLIAAVDTADGEGEAFVYGGSGNDRIVLSGGNYTVLGGKGDDIVVVSDTSFVLGETGNDVFVLNLDVDKDSQEDPSTPILEGGDGFDVLVLRSISQVGAFGLYIDGLTSDEDEGVGFSIAAQSDRQTILAMPIVNSVEALQLTEYADALNIEDGALKAPIFVDFGGFAPGEITKSDWDEIDFSSLSHGITMVNGTTRNRDDALPELAGGRLGFWGELALSLPYLFGSTPDILAFGTQESNNALRFAGAEKITGTDHSDVLWFGEPGYLSRLLGNWPADLEKPAFAEVDGGAGNDRIVFHGSHYVGAGQEIPEEFGGAKATPNSDTGEQEGVSIAQTEFRTIIRGGEGDDRLYAKDGSGAILVGGEGRDFLFNTSAKGQIYGDTIDGLDSEGNPLSHEGSENADVFWYWPNTFIMDAQPNDILQLFGFPLLGGTNSVLGVPVGNDSMAIDWTNPFTFYGVTHSGQLLIYNALFAAAGFGKGPGHDPFPAGVMVVEDYDFGGWEDASWGVPKAGDLGRVSIAANDNSLQSKKAA